MDLITACYLALVVVWWSQVDAKFNPYREIDQLVGRTAPKANDADAYAIAIEKILAEGFSSSLERGLKNYLQLAKLGGNLQKSCTPNTLPLLEDIGNYLGKQSESKKAEVQNLKINKFMLELIFRHGQECQLEMVTKYKSLRSLSDKQTVSNMETFGKDFMIQLFKLTRYVPKKMPSNDVRIRNILAGTEGELTGLTELVDLCEDSVKRGLSKLFDECLIENSGPILYTATKLSKNLLRLAIIGVLKQTMNAAFIPFKPDVSLSKSKFNVNFETYLEEPCDRVRFRWHRIFELLDEEQEFVNQLEFYNVPPKEYQFSYAWLGYNLCKIITSKSYSSHSSNLLSCVRQFDYADEFKASIQVDYLNYV